jgi:hypothetical protein
VHPCRRIVIEGFIHFVLAMGLAMGGQLMCVSAGHQMLCVAMVHCAASAAKPANIGTFSWRVLEWQHLLLPALFQELL